MKVLVLSDLHLEFAPFEPASDLEFDVVILAGDIHSPAKRAVRWASDRFRGESVVYLLGNHEYITTAASTRRWLKHAAKPKAATSICWTATNW